MPSTVTAKALREQLTPLANALYQLRDKFNDPAYKWTAEDEANFAKAHKDYEDLKARAQRLEAVERVETEMAARASDVPPPGREDTDPRGGTKSKKGRRADAANAPTEEERALAFQGWFRATVGMGVKKRHQDALRKVGANPHDRNLTVRLARDFEQVRAAYAKGGGGFQRAQSINVQTLGGYAIPEGFVNNLEVAQLAYADVARWADVRRTDGFGDWPWPTANDTANKGHMLAENTGVATTDVPFGQMVMHAFKATTDAVLIPAELLEDSPIPMAEEVGRLLGTRMGRLKADKCTFGTGGGEPTGYVTSATVGVTAASSTAIAADEIYALKHSVDPAYRPGAMFTFHDNTLLTVKKLKDGIGRYLWQASLAGAAPDTLDGDPIGINQSMASSIASGNVTMAYGQMKMFKLRDVSKVRMRTLVERYADFDQIGMMAFYRYDSQILDPGTHPIKTLKQP